MDIDQLLYRLAVALGIGLIAGLERGWKTREAEPGSRAAGIRTFALSGLLGGITAAVAQSIGSAEGAAVVLGFGFAAYAVVVALFEREANRNSDSYSATTTIAALLTYALGAYAVIGDMRVAAAAAVAATGILAAREDIHGWVARLTWPELRAALVLLAMTVIVLPMVPDTVIGPGGGVNPRQIWVIAIVLAGVSFVGYGAVKLFGAERGVLLAAAAGGLVSSTAVTLTNARRAAIGEGAPHVLAAGVAIASAVSFLRVLAIVSALKADLLVIIAPALGAATLAAVVFALALVRWGGGDDDGKSAAPAVFSNPFSFWPVVGFAVLLAVVIVLARFVGENFGAQGALLGAIGLGLADVDTVTISVSQLVPATLSAQAASQAILAAITSNMVAKLAVGVGIGRGRFGRDLGVMALVCAAAGVGALWASGGF